MKTIRLVGRWQVPEMVYVEPETLTDARALIVVLLARQTVKRAYREYFQQWMHEWYEKELFTELEQP